MRRRGNLWVPDDYSGERIVRPGPARYATGTGTGTTRGGGLARTGGLRGGGDDNAKTTATFAGTNTVLAVEGWLLIAADAVAGLAFGVYQSSAYRLMVQIGNAGAGVCPIIVGIGNGTYVTCTGPSYATGVWHRVGVSFNGGGAIDADRVALFVDGAPAALTFAGATPTARPTSGIFTALAVNQTGSGGSKTTVTALRVWNATRSQAEFAATAGVRRLGATTNLMGEWLTEPEAGTTCADSSGNNKPMSFLTDTSQPTRTTHVWAGGPV